MNRSSAPMAHSPDGSSGPARAPLTTGPSIHPSGTGRHLERVARAITDKAVQQDIDIFFLGVEPLFSGVRLYGEASNAPWLVARADDDPMVRSGVPIPRRQLLHLHRMVRAGFDFPFVYLAHELGPRDGGGGKDPSLTDHFRVLNDVQAKALLPGVPSPPRSVRTARRIDRAARTAWDAAGALWSAALTAGLATASVLPVLALIALDPAVLGAVVLPGQAPKSGTPAAWFLLTHWAW